MYKISSPGSGWQALLCCCNCCCRPSSFKHNTPPHFIQLFHYSRSHASWRPPIGLPLRVTLRFNWNTSKLTNNQSCRLFRRRCRWESYGVTTTKMAICPRNIPKTSGLLQFRDQQNHRPKTESRLASSTVCAVANKCARVVALIKHLTRA